MLVKLLLLRMVYLTKIVGSLLLLDNLGFVLFVLFSTRYNILEHILTLVSIFKVLFSLFFFLWKKPRCNKFRFLFHLSSFHSCLISVQSSLLFQWKIMETDGTAFWSTEIKYQLKIKVDIFSKINSWKNKV